MFTNVRVEERQGRGRCVIATKTISAGQLVFECKPYAATLQAHAAIEYCHNCWKQNSSLQRCARCQYARYCNATCQVIIIIVVIITITITITIIICCCCWLMLNA